MGHEHPKTDSDMAHVSEGAPNMRRSVCRGVKYEVQPIKRAALLMGICRWPPSSPDYSSATLRTAAKFSTFGSGAGLWGLQACVVRRKLSGDTHLV